jgi:hypothetical protein
MPLPAYAYFAQYTVIAEEDIIGEETCGTAQAPNAKSSDLT